MIWTLLGSPIYWIGQKVPLVFLVQVKDTFFIVIKNFIERHIHPFVLLLTCVHSVIQLCLTLCDPMDRGLGQAPLSMVFPGKNTGMGLPFPPPWDLSNPGIKPPSVTSPADVSPLCHLGSPFFHYPLSFFRQLHNSIFSKLFIFFSKELFCDFNSLSGNWNFFPLREFFKD